MMSTTGQDPNAPPDEDRAGHSGEAPGGALATPATPEGRDVAEDEGEEA